MRTTILCLMAMVATSTLTSCEKLLMYHVDKYRDNVEEREERRLVHPFELMLTTKEPELDYVRFYGDSQDVKSPLSPEADDWFSLTRNLDGSFNFKIEYRSAWYTDVTYSLVSVHLHSAPGVAFELNKRYHFGDITGRDIDGLATERSYVDLIIGNIKEQGWDEWKYTSTYGWIEFTYIGSNEGSNNPFIYDNAAIIDATFYFETVDPESGEVIVKAEECTFKNCWGSESVD